MNRGTARSTTEEIAESAGYSLGEEIANGITHGVGALLSVAGLTLLLVMAADQGGVLRITSAVIYGTSLILLYLTSTLYHSLQVPRVKKLFQVMDHCAIYLLIAGTYTPIMLINLQGTWGYSMMAIIWTLAIFGMTFKVCCKKWFPGASLLLYLVMGWMAVIASGELIENLAPGGLQLLLIGGIIYTAGTIFYACDRIPFNHAIWHLFVLGGSVFHFFAIYGYVIPVA